jgi:hypothetical protein
LPVLLRNVRTAPSLFLTELPIVPLLLCQSVFGFASSWDRTLLSPLSPTACHIWTLCLSQLGHSVSRCLTVSCPLPQSGQVPSPSRRIHYRHWASRATPSLGFVQITSSRHTPRATRLSPSCCCTKCLWHPVTPASHSRW